jgi:predicted naringenin-chalcone synthase
MPEGLTDFVRRGPPDKNVVVCVSLCVSVANKNKKRVFVRVCLLALWNAEPIPPGWPIHKKC